MDIDDLRSYLVISRLASLRAAGEVLHQTPSALSKAVRRLEESLNTPLFDRVGKALRLNAAGERLVARATELIALADATEAEFHGHHAPLRCRAAGPAVLQGAFGAEMIDRLSKDGAVARIDFRSCFEDEAMTALAVGDVDLALVTAVALQNASPAHIASARLGDVRMQVAAGPGHPLVGRTRVRVAEVLAHDFACIDHSPFCGLPRGTRSDGWRDDKLPREVRYWVDDLQVLLALVHRGLALAYLPDFAIAMCTGLNRIKVVDCPFDCVEQAHLAWRVGSRQASTARGHARPDVGSS